MRYLFLDSLEVSSERTPLQSEGCSDTTEEESCDEELEEEEFVIDEEQQRCDLRRFSASTFSTDQRFLSVKNE
uniref:Uncharacterized protein n=1 Tax=Parascaris equorum TaxID=6256 RepID=A0A914RW13_PAREQ